MSYDDWSEFRPKRVTSLSRDGLALTWSRMPVADEGLLNWLSDEGLCDWVSVETGSGHDV